MSSEIIVVLVLIVLAIGFIIWVRINSRDHDRARRANSVGEKDERARESNQ